MSLDPELKALLSNLLEGQVKLAEGQSRHEKRFDHLEEAVGQVRMNLTDLACSTEASFTRVYDQLESIDQRVELVGDRLDTLSGRVDGLSDRIDGLDRRVDGLDRRVDGLATNVSSLNNRLDSFNRNVLEGFTRGAERDRHIEDQLRSTQAAITKLQRFGEPPPTDKPR